MRVLQQIFSSRAGTTAALSVIAVVVILSWKVVSFATAGAAAANAVAAAASADAETPHGASWQQEMALLGIDVEGPNEATSTDHLAMIGPMVSAELVGEYVGLQSSGAFSSSTAQQAADGIAENVRAVVPSKTYVLADLRTDNDTSYKRMLTYRADLRDALVPLLQNTNAELELYAKYVETSDPNYLEQLKAAAANYRAAAEKTLLVVVPRDAVNYHIAILNAMQQFASVLDAMATHTADPLTNAALLRSYNKAEQDMYTSFNNLTAYYSQKTP